MTALNAIPAAGTIAPVDCDVIYAIGDIHGRYDLLRALLAQIADDVATLPADSDVACVFMGDYIDRGPDSAAVVSALIWLKRNAPFDCIFLRGNHEQVMLDYIADPGPAAAWLRFGGRETLRSYGVEVPGAAIEDLDYDALRDALLDRLPVSHLAFVQGLATHYESERHIFVHAGLRPGIPLSRQTDEDLLWIRDDFLEHDGGFEKRVVHGHTWTSDEPEVTDQRIGLDTGAYETGVLTAVRLTADETRFLRARDDTPRGNAAPPDPA